MTVGTFEAYHGGGWGGDTIVGGGAGNTERRTIYEDLILILGNSIFYLLKGCCLGSMVLAYVFWSCKIFSINSSIRAHTRHASWYCICLGPLPLWREAYGATTQNTAIAGSDVS